MRLGLDREGSGQECDCFLAGFGSENGGPQLCNLQEPGYACMHGWQGAAPTGRLDAPSHGRLATKDRAALG